MLVGKYICQDALKLPDFHEFKLSLPQSDLKKKQGCLLLTYSMTC